MVDIEHLWNMLKGIFPLFENNGGQHSQISMDTYKSVGSLLIKLDIFECFCDMLWLEMCSVIRNQIVPKFWTYYDTNSVANFSSKNISSELRYQLFEKFVCSVNELDTNYRELQAILKHLHLLRSYNIPGDYNTYGEKSLQEFLREALLGQLPANFNQVVHSFYFVSFEIFSNINSQHEDLNDDTDSSGSKEIFCKGCKYQIGSCSCQYLMATTNEINGKLSKMLLLDRIAGETMTSLIKQRIKDHINETCTGIFDKSHLKPLEAWLDNVVINWLKQTFYVRSKERNENSFKFESIIDGFKVKLEYLLYENIGQSIIEQFFSIIIDFPDSIPAIDDLKICMEKIDMRKNLIKSLKRSLEVRILHPGVNTMDILTGYVAAIKAIRHLDSSGVILETVTAPIKEYLRKRSDTVRRVVTGLTEDGPTDLSEELAKGEILNENTGPKINDDLNNWESWMPDPFGIEQITQTAAKSSSRSADVISMVVDIYGSKELFMNEYRNLMADRLLSQLDFNPEREIRNLELLKLRFGETLLHSCEVMLKDVADSKRINTHINSDKSYADSKCFDISTLIVSAQFWPPFNKESLELPEELANEFQKYTKSYEAYKGNRTLNWRNVTGRVNIEVELGSRVIEMTVPPTQAIILYHFQNKSEYSLDELCALMKVPSTILRRRIGFWQTHGLISETRPGVFSLIENEVPKSELNDLSHLNNDEEDNESAMASALEQREEELQVFWSYIVGMLTNLDSLPLERIHQMLKLFASQGVGVEFSQDELKNFLQRKVRDHKLLYSGGVYQLAK